LYDDFGIKPIIDIRNAWKTDEETRIVDGFENVVQNYKGDIYTGKQIVSWYFRL
jgi:hypothetical protein